MVYPQNALPRRHGMAYNIDFVQPIAADSRTIRASTRRLHEIPPFEVCSSPPNHRLRIFFPLGGRHDSSNRLETSIRSVNAGLRVPGLASGSPMLESARAASAGTQESATAVVVSHGCPAGGINVLLRLSKASALKRELTHARSGDSTALQTPAKSIPLFPCPPLQISTASLRPRRSAQIPGCRPPILRTLPILRG